MARETPWVVSHTRMYWDYSSNTWMTTIATPDVAASGKHRILACVDVLLDELMKRTARTARCSSPNGEGTLIYHPGKPGSRAAVSVAPGDAAARCGQGARAQSGGAGGYSMRALGFVVKRICKPLSIRPRACALDKWIIC
ncbi:hypothetical protein LOY35_11390 [Pseudomonas sp. B21-028]|uniref:hypothetical protein n=1 Tax=Pseudomonas sp. B21-028 TaxID=2895480 RepID=UPI00215E1847|nr:hypothetical protein [Pseudomonas sp. B21-028]UVL86143.1 hypothetical protein LOY35_11390 [Pseudomonas sp. B21-028]